jgi:hypothetical protein
MHDMALITPPGRHLRWASCMTGMRPVNSAVALGWWLKGEGGEMRK